MPFTNVDLKKCKSLFFFFLAEENKGYGIRTFKKKKCFVWGRIQPVKSHPLEANLHLEAVH